MAQEPKYPVQTVMKALELLNHLAKNTGNLGAGVSELSDALGIGKSTVHRLLDTFIRTWKEIKRNDRLWNNQRKRNDHYFQDGIYEQWDEQQCKPGRV